MAVVCDGDGTAGNNESLQLASGVITQYPISMAFHFKAADVRVMGLNLVDQATTSGHLGLAVRGDQTGDYVRCYHNTFGAGGAAVANTSTGYTANQWHHAAGVISRTGGTTNQCTAYLDGGGGVTDSQAGNAFGGLDVCDLHRISDSTPVYSTGECTYAEVAIWDGVALTRAECEALAKGVSPLMIHRDKLRMYAPLGGLETLKTDNYDMIGGLTFTATNGPTTGEHPSQLIYPSQPQTGFAEAADLATGQPIAKRMRGVPGMLGAQRVRFGRGW